MWVHVIQASPPSATAPACGLRARTCSPQTPSLQQEALGHVAELGTPGPESSLQSMGAGCWRINPDPRMDDSEAASMCHRIENIQLLSVRAPQRNRTNKIDR